MNALARWWAALSDAVAPRRDARVFGVGAAKTGTHTLAAMFDGVPAAHERDAEALIERLLDPACDARAMRRALRKRDRTCNLKIDASQVNVYLLDHLEALFPDSRYVLTVRAPEAWLRSIVDDSMRRNVSDTWLRFREFRFGRVPAGSHDAPLTERGLYPLAGYLGYWCEAIVSVTGRIPPERLLVVCTEDLDRRAHDIATFCGLPAEAVPERSVREFSNPERFGIVAALDPGYLADSVDAICGDLARRHGLAVAAPAREVRAA